MNEEAFKISFLAPIAKGEKAQFMLIGTTDMKRRATALISASAGKALIDKIKKPEKPVEHEEIAFELTATHLLIFCDNMTFMMPVTMLPQLQKQAQDIPIDDVLEMSPSDQLNNEEVEIVAA